MVNSSYKIFCLYKRIPGIFNKMNFDLYSMLENPVPKPIFTKTKQFIKNQCYRIFNEIENSYYSFDDVVSFLIYRSLWDDSVDLLKVTDLNIEKFKNSFSKNQLIKDKGVINDLNKETNFFHIKEYFSLRENGESLIYRLCMGEIVSIYFFIYFANTELTGFFSRAKIKDRNVRYSKFIKTTDILTERINVETYKQLETEQE